MEEDELKNKLNTAIESLFKFDGFLLEKNVHERSITHKLAGYLETLFLSHDVDVEYNRRVEENRFLVKRLEEIQGSEDGDNDKGEIYPDIIIHKRGENDSNLVVIEVKKDRSEGKEDDKEKLRAIVKQLEYQFCVFLVLPTKSKTEYSHVELKIKELEFEN